MGSINFAEFNLDLPSQRRKLLTAIQPERKAVIEMHSELLGLFKKEMDFRRNGENEDDDEAPDDSFENLYWCALLLYLVGDLSDVELLWEAKFINFDTSCGFDGQFLVGAGFDQTVRYLADRKLNDIAKYLERMKECGDFDDLSEWEKVRIEYFYPHLH